MTFAAGRFSLDDQGLAIFDNRLTVLPGDDVSQWRRLVERETA